MKLKDLLECYAFLFTGIVTFGGFFLIMFAISQIMGYSMSDEIGHGDLSICLLISVAILPLYMYIMSRPVTWIANLFNK